MIEMREEVSGLKKVMIQNIDTLLQRGEKLNILVEKSDRYNSAYIFLPLLYLGCNDCLQVKPSVA